MSGYTIPYVVQQTPRGERTLDLYSRLLSERIIYLGTEIDDGVANAVIAQMLHLSSENPELPMSLYLKDGMQLKQAIAMVGGLSKDAKSSAVVIWRRKKGQSEPEKLIVNFKDIQKEKIKDIQLQPYDIVDVPDNSGSASAIFRNLIMGAGTGSLTSAATGLPLRVIY